MSVKPVTDLKAVTVDQALEIQKISGVPMGEWFQPLNQLAAMRAILIVAGPNEPEDVDALSVFDLPEYVNAGDMDEDLDASGAPGTSSASGSREPSALRPTG